MKQIAVGIMSTIRNYCEIEPALEQEYKNTQGWLKVKKLRQITDGLESAQEAVYADSANIKVKDFEGVTKKRSSQNVDHASSRRNLTKNDSTTE